MLDWLKRRAETRRIGPLLYEQIVAQARQPAIYRRCAIPDTMDGRLEMILLHVILVLGRLRREGNAGQRIGQRLMETLVADLDDTLRQIGLGDDSVAHRIPKLAGALEERSRDYGLALSAAPDTASAPTLSLEAALLAHVYRLTKPSAAAEANASHLADYVRRCNSAIDAIPGADIRAGRLNLPHELSE